MSLKNNCLASATPRIFYISPSMTGEDGVWRPMAPMTPDISMISGPHTLSEAAICAADWWLEAFRTKDFSESEFRNRFSKFRYIQIFVRSSDGSTVRLGCVNILKGRAPVRKCNFWVENNFYLKGARVVTTEGEHLDTTIESVLKRACQRMPLVAAAIELATEKHELEIKLAETVVAEMESPSSYFSIAPRDVFNYIVGPYIFGHNY